MWKRIEAGAVAGLVAAFLVEVAMLGRTITGLDGHSLSALAVVAEAAHARGALAGGLIALGYGGVIGALFGWLAHRQRFSELSGLFWGVLYGVSWAIVSSLVVVPLLQGAIPFGAAALALMAPALFASGVGHVLYGAMLGVAFAVINNHVMRSREEGRQQPAERRAA